jgi:hypothetical protein
MQVKKASFGCRLRTIALEIYLSAPHAAIVFVLQRFQDEVLAARAIVKIWASSCRRNRLHRSWFECRKTCELRTKIDGADLER